MENKIIQKAYNEVLKEQESLSFEKQYDSLGFDKRWKEEIIKEAQRQLLTEICFNRPENLSLSEYLADKIIELED